jgi:hypothetical protein
VNVVLPAPLPCLGCAGRGADRLSTIGVQVNSVDCPFRLSGSPVIAAAGCTAGPEARDRDATSAETY